jgi:hypothetical protein
MAWWPFGKKKPGEPDHADALASPAGGPDAPAPTIFVPPEFGGGANGNVDQVTIPPVRGDGAPGDPFAAPAGRDPFAQTLDDPGAPQANAPQARRAPPTVDPFAAPDPFAQPQGDPFGDQGAPAMDPFGGPAHSPAAAPDPFEIPPNQDFAQTLADPEPVPPPRRAAQPSQQSWGAQPGYAPGAPGFGSAPGGAPDSFGVPPDAHEVTMRLPPGSQPGGNAPQPAFHTMTVPVAPDPEVKGSRPGPAELKAPMPLEDNAMLAKTTLSPEKRRLGRALLAGGPITHERLIEELERAGKGQSVLGKALLQSNFPKEDELLAVLIARVRIPKINVKNTKIPLETVKILPADIAKKTKMLPIEKLGDILVVVSPDISDENALAQVRRATGCLISPIQCAPEGFDEVLAGYYDRVAQSEPAPPAATSGSAPTPAGRAPDEGPLAALPAEDMSDDWTRVYAAAGPVPADEVLL